MPFDTTPPIIFEDEKIRQVYDLLARPDGWCKGRFAVTRDRLSTPCLDPDAYAFCLSGAAMRVGLHVEEFAARLGFTDAASMERWNDYIADQQAVLDRLRAAISRA